VRKIEVAISDLKRTLVSGAYLGLRRVTKDKENKMPVGGKIGCLDRKLVLKGGSKEDRIEAREWISLFWHEAAVRESPGHYKS
jgi:hypothetical protein